MATQIQLRRGTATQNNAFTGAVGEVTADTTNNKLRLHDGSTAGGHEIGGGTFADIAGGGTFTGAVEFQDELRVRDNDIYFYEGTDTAYTASIFAHSGGLNINQNLGNFKISMGGSSSDAEIAIPAVGAFYVKRGNTEKFKVESTGVTIPLASSGDVFQVTNSSGGTLISAVSDGTVRVKHAGSTKITTSSSGITVAGALTAGGLVYPTTDGSAGQFLKTDGNGGLAFADAGGGLDYFTEGISTSSPHSASSGAVKLEASGTPARLDVYLHPKDDGALCNGSEGDGNKRGVFAVDWQATRDNADEVASGGRSAILGGSGNKATVNWSTAVGGRSNTASGVYSFIGGGYANTASGNSSAISGGQDNTATTDHATVVGGFNNDATNTKAFIGSGQNNTASGSASVLGGGSGNTVSNYYGFIGGGTSNVSSGVSSAIAGGSNNAASGQNGFVGGGSYVTSSGTYSAVAGGQGNTASSEHSFVGGGQTNEAKTSTHATVVGGQNNDATGIQSFVGGGSSNTASGSPSTVCGGLSNTASSSYSFVGGGETNEAKDNSHAAVAGGKNNDAAGGYSFVGGGNQNTANASNSTAVGGYLNTASSNSAFIGGGMSNTASANYSSAIGGYNNTASASYATAVGETCTASAEAAVAIGNNHNASGANSACLGGYSNKADARNAICLGGNRGDTRGTIGKTVFAAGNSPIGFTYGYSQAALLVVGASTTDATTTTLRSDQNSASATNQCVLENGGSLYAFTITVVGRETSTGHYASIKFEGVIDKQDSSSNVTIRTTPTKTVLATNGDGSNWDAAVDADTTNQALRVKVTGEASTTIKWVAKIDTIELGL